MTSQTIIVLVAFGDMYFLASRQPKVRLVICYNPRMDTETTPAPPTIQDGVPIAEAAERLKLSVEAVRKRVQRGTLPARKGEDGLWYVLLDGLDGTTPVPDGDQDSGQTQVVDTLRDEVQWLRLELSRRNEELKAERESRAEAERRRDILFAQFNEQLKQISSTAETMHEAVEAVAHEVVDKPEAAGVSLSWWQRLLLGKRLTN